MSKAMRKGLGILMAIALVIGLIIPTGLPAYAKDQTGDGSDGIVAIHMYEKSNGWDVQYVDLDFGGFDTHDYAIADDIGYRQYVYCILPTRNPGADATKNQHFRWRWNLGANTYIWNNNRAMLENTDWAPEASQLSDLEGLAAIIYYGQKNEYSYGDIQDAVYWWVTSGKEGAPDYAGQQYQNDITKAYQNGEAKAPASYGLYMYVADNEVTEMVQNTVGLAIWSEEEETKKPSITNTTAKVNDTATEVEIAAGEEGTFTDEVTLENLEEGKEYTVVSTLQKDGEDFDTATTTVKDQTSITVTFSKKVTEAGEYKVKTELKDGDEVVATHNGDFDVESETVKVTVGEKKPTVKTKVNPSEIEAAADQSITDTVSLSDLTKDVEYTITGKLVDEDGNEVKATVEAITFTADAETAEKEMPFSGIDATDLAGKKLVVFETLSWKEGDETKEVKHEDLNDADQTVTVKDKEPEEVEVSITKKILGGDELEGAKIEVSDKELGTVVTDGEWTSTTEAHVLKLKAGSYILTETAAPEGYEQITTKIEFTVAEDGTVTVVTTEVDGGGKVSVSGKNIILENAPVKEETKGELKTTVTAGGKTASDSAAITLSASEAADVTEVTDKIDYTGLIAGATYKVSGTLNEVENGKAVKEVATATEELVAEEADGTWEITFKDVKLEAGKTYVVFEEATLIKDADGKDVEEGETIEHKNPDDLAQTVKVEAAEEPPVEEEEKPNVPGDDNGNKTPDDADKNNTTKPTDDTPSKTPEKTTTTTTTTKTNNTPKTGDESNAVLWIGLLALAGAALAGIKVYSTKRK